MKFDFENQVVLVTGGSRGIGRHISLMFADAGAKVAVNFRGNQVAAQQTLDSLSGQDHMLVQGSLESQDEIVSIVNRTLDHYGRVDVLINNAGVFDEHPIAKTSFEEWVNVWQKTIQTNLIGTAHLTYLVAQAMIKQGGGRIVNVSSRGAFRGEPDAPAYGASKAGLNSMGQSLAKALAPHNIFVHTVAPGFVETDMVAGHLEGTSGDEIRNQSPLGRVAKPEEVARTVLFLAAPGTEFLTGCIVDVNGASYLRT